MGFFRPLLCLPLYNARQSQFQFVVTSIRPWTHKQQSQGGLEAARPFPQGIQILGAD